MKKGKEEGRGLHSGPGHLASSLDLFYMLPVVNDQEKSEASGLPATSVTPVAPPLIFAVYLVFASNFVEGMSVTEVGLVVGFQLNAWCEL